MITVIKKHVKLIIIFIKKIILFNSSCQGTV